jgi:Cytosol aminopeptidase family, N-terminal domain
MSLRIDVAELGLPAIDTIEVDALAVFVGPERPLQGLAGFVDWRLCGGLSRAIRDGLFAADRREALLLPSRGRVAAARIFCLGLGAAPLGSRDFAEAARWANDALMRAGSASFATSFPPVRPEGEPVATARLWLEAAVRFTGRKQVILGDAPVLKRELLQAAQQLGADVEVIAPPIRVEMPGRPAPLPPRTAVVR